LATALTGAAETQVVVNGTIPPDTPNASHQGTKTIRIKRNDGQYTLHTYSSWSGNTFTLSSATNFSTNPASAGNNVFISYIDKLADATSASFSGVFNADRNLFIRVRSGTTGTPIKTFETTGTLTSAGGSTTAIRTPDV
jgi:hypothetical protein